MVFDFDGVIVDSEPTHYAAFAHILSERGISLTGEDYYSKYLGLDDHDCFERVFREHGQTADEQAIRQMIAAKTRLVQGAMASSIQPMPGAVELIHAAEADAIPLAICSGARRPEIDLAARTVKVRDSFMTIVSAEDVTCGKPDPQGYRLALEELCRLSGRGLLAARSLVVEDAPAGISAGKQLGMKVLAVTTSCPAAALAMADLVVDSLADVTIARLEQLFVE